MRKKLFLIFMSVAILISCNENKKESKSEMKKEITAKEILGNPEYLAMSYGGYRHIDHSIEPTLEELKEDMKILAALGVRVLRTYKVHFPQASNILKAISELKKEDAGFEMYVMLGAWIDCKNAWTEFKPIHNEESDRNAVEIKEVVRLVNQYPTIVKVIAVGNEAMVKWATSYYVEPWIILKWVNYLQDLKKEGELPKDLWITSSDDFSSWGGGDEGYHTEDLGKLIKTVDYVSMHTYPYHNTHYNPEFWGVPEEEAQFYDLEKIDKAMIRARDFAKSQYKAVLNYVKSIDPEKTVHIGETGWATISNGYYGSNGSKATDEYKEALYYNYIREWTNQEGISCFYFEAFNEQWKDGNNPKGSENHFGLITIDGKAKYALWNLVDKGIFKGLTRNGKPITKTYNGDMEAMMKSVLVPNIKK